MRRWLPLAALLGCALTAALLPAPAMASGAPGTISLSWNDCGTFGAVDKTFACNSNTGSAVMVGSFVAPDSVTKLTGEEMVIDLIVADATLPKWWEFKNVGTCRTGSGAANIVFGVNCLDYYGGAGSPTIGFSAYQQGWLGVNTARIKLVSAVSQATAYAINAGDEFYSFNFSINYAKTVGTTCPGCNFSVCLVFNSMILAQPNDGDPLHQRKFLYVPGIPANPPSLASNMVTWQGTGPDCQLVPAKSRTWGSIKSLYR